MPPNKDVGQNNAERNRNRGNRRNGRNRGNGGNNNNKPKQE